MSNLNDAFTTSNSGLSINRPLTFPNEAQNGLMIDPKDPQFGWKDLLGPIIVRGIGAADPTFDTFIGTVRQYKFAVNDEVYLVFHMPHDWAVGTDMFLHVHWAHNVASVTTGTVTFSAEMTFAKGFDQEAFPTTKTMTITQNASTTQYQHMVAEAQMSMAGGSATLLNTNDLEVDGIILVKLKLTDNTMDASAIPFVFTSDIHYQSTQLSTKNKSPDFYT